MTMKNWLVFSIARPITADQPLPDLLRAASRAPNPRAAVSATTITVPIAMAISTNSMSPSLPARAGTAAAAPSGDSSQVGGPG